MFLPSVGPQRQQTLKLVCETYFLQKCIKIKANLVKMKEINVCANVELNAERYKCVFSWYMWDVGRMALTQHFTAAQHSCAIFTLTLSSVISVVYITNNNKPIVKKKKLLTSLAVQNKMDSKAIEGLSEFASSLPNSDL